jgi:hypothetical protein
VWWAGAASARRYAARCRYAARHRAAPPRTARCRKALVRPACLVAACALTLQPAGAAFTSSTANTGNTLTSGSVGITNERTGSVVFSGVSGLIPGNTATKCVTVTYGGTVAASVKLYASAYSDTGLADDLHLTLEEGDGGTYTSCTGFTRTSYLINDQALATVFNPSGTASRRDYASGLGGTWTPAANPTVKTYRFTYSLPPATGNSAQATNVAVTFTWEARSI